MSKFVAYLKIGRKYGSKKLNEDFEKTMENGIDALRKSAEISFKIDDDFFSMSLYMRYISLSN